MKLVEELKKQSSKWIKTKNEIYSKFYWQDGNGIFSVNPAEIEKVIDYIEQQHEHHKYYSFQDEFKDFLDKNDIGYDERYIWD